MRRSLAMTAAEASRVKTDEKKPVRSTYTLATILNAPEMSTRVSETGGGHGKLCNLSAR